MGWGTDTFHLTHRGWEINGTCEHRYRSGPDVLWSRWTATKGGQVLHGVEERNSNCQAYGAAIRAIDAIEVGESE